ncbi:MAG TPA: c-type cytochrome [Mucilaginibacter sp.]|nr:c-type cytochrome [Mucilaginibacter sp.]
MKKVSFIAIGLSLMLAACSGNKSGNGSSSDSTSTAAATDSTAATTSSTASTGMSNPNAPGAQLIAKNDCLTCHKEQEKVVGPAYADVAEKYKSAPAGIVDTLAEKVIKGGSGNWGTTPMTPHPAVSMDDARTMVKYILSLKKQ